MRSAVRSVDVFPTKLHLKEPFRVAYEVEEDAWNILVRLTTAEGEVGWGNACPDPEVTGETPASVLKTLRKLTPRVVGEDAHRINRVNYIMEEVVGGNLTAKAGVNLALYDILGKEAGLPVTKMLGGFKDRIQTSISIGILPLEETVGKAKAHVAQGFKVLKLKCGLDPEDDIRRAIAVREAVGRDILLRLDANQGYDVGTALRVVDALENIYGVDIELIEQPTPAGELAQLKEVTGASSVPIMADESVQSILDTFVVTAGQMADLINIKLMKTGGITGALRVNHIAQAGGIPAMVGCMSESIVSVAAGLHFACSQRNIEYADLDSHFDFERDLAKGGASFEEGYLYPLDRPGYGLEVDEA
ncbi:MAG TPA: dipeptide epimerase, partial [Candidatus Thermoplasmatota archaeon]|nr:dipeptide epimerase [Candidatus Thermoplasmatota archaeon]